MADDKREGEPRKTLFDDRPRERSGGMQPGEPQATWLKEFVGEEADRSRENLEEWFAEIPPADRDEIRARLLSGDDTGYRSALSELFLHHVFHGEGYAVEIHPEIPGTTRRTDFMVSGKSGRTYIEVRNVSRGAGPAAEEARLATIKKELNKVRTKDFFLMLSWELVERVPRMSEVRRDVEDWLSGLDPDSIDPEELPRLRVESEGVNFELAAIPKKADARNDTAEQLVGMEMEPVRIVPGRQRIRNALREKAGRYGKIGSTFVIALVSEDLAVVIEEAMEALYGSSVADFWLDGERVVRSRERRRQDGFFGMTKTGPKNTRVSAILFVRKLTPWTPELVEMAVFHNPFAEFPLAQGALPAREFIVAKRDDDQLTMGWTDSESDV